ncbi:hypothetical protein SAMN05660461_4528 [Chitinophaga ginsengisegetis]|uniref:Uncharacterized protein n=1 Tax=Chitinophaga ginsengisegetis TaxID=393003 RepID=A0A1T5P7H4_9BACT|nr:hypothetical protein [Chitinophaga ginsengisegetis]MDR6567691.1 hypothetical protein [Chitinophaga ginsengisegetis]MDR6647754.1 hypothetical protein [Chitinophaga ginsengisegetis]MDR6654104.1 hypothetical protein [Chitinophaga ginsengisegetis]SKD08652.1 hypothetical protein SAMN05660461_4528 [Chitinophaga ginsengisegetis]
MIEESDIRIGNYVSYFDYNMEETAFVVEGILQGFVYNSGLPLSKLPYAKVNPMVLDVDLLLRFGFIKGDPDYGEDVNVYSLKYNRLHSVHIRHENEVFQPLTDAAEGLVPYGRAIVHVHQLQNLFHAVTRDELTLFE